MSPTLVLKLMGPHGGEGRRHFLPYCAPELRSDQLGELPGQVPGPFLPRPRRSLRNSWRPTASCWPSLEGEGVLTIHNMILSDDVDVAKLDYEDALSYATFLASRLIVFYGELKPSAVIGGFDSLHGSLGYAVAKRAGILWTSLFFSPLPPGLVAVCRDLTPASMITFEPGRAGSLVGLAEQVMREFESRKIAAAAYIPPKLFSPAFIFKQILTTAAHAEHGVSRQAVAEPPSGDLRTTATYSVRVIIGEALRPSR